jgi:hypothetical protein
LGFTKIDNKHAILKLFNGTNFTTFDNLYQNSKEDNKIISIIFYEKFEELN